MTEILTESFCERCGTRYTFESSAPRKSRVGRVRVLSKGLRNFVLSDETTMSEAMADARSEVELAATTHQLDAFHKTFNFCLSCRQYTCGNCWNEIDGRCLTCAPIPGRELVVEAVPVAASAGVAIAAAAELDPGEPVEAPADWPEVEMSRRLGAFAAVAAVTEPADGGVASPDVGEVSVAAMEPEQLPVRGLTPGQSLEDAVAVYEAELDAEADAEAEAVALVAAEELAAEAAEPEAPEVEPEPEPVAVAEAVALVAAAELAAEAAEPEAPEVEPEPEPVAVAEAVALVAAAELAAEAAEPEAEAPEVEPEPEPVAVAPEPVDIVEQPTWPMPPAAPAPVTAPAPAPEPSQPVQPAWLTVAPDDGTAPQWPTAPSWASRPSPRPGVQPTLAGRPFLPQSDASALWAASAQEVLSGGPSKGSAQAAAPAATAQPCVNCGLSLSANARFCRRCGTRQG